MLWVILLEGWASSRDALSLKASSLTFTKPHLFCVVGVVSRFRQVPCINHWNDIIRILRYLKKDLGHGFLYEDKGSTQISRYCDADWTRSHMDIVLLLEEKEVVLVA